MCKAWLNAHGKERTSLLDCVIQSNPMHSENIALPCTCAAHSNTLLEHGHGNGSPRSWAFQKRVD